MKLQKYQGHLNSVFNKQLEDSARERAELFQKLQLLQAKIDAQPQPPLVQPARGSAVGLAAQHAAAYTLPPPVYVPTGGSSFDISIPQSLGQGSVACATTTTRLRTFNNHHQQQAILAQRQEEEILASRQENQNVLSSMLMQMIAHHQGRRPSMLMQMIVDHHRFQLSKLQQSHSVQRISQSLSVCERAISLLLIATLLPQRGVKDGYMQLTTCCSGAGGQGRGQRLLNSLYETEDLEKPVDDFITILEGMETIDPKISGGLLKIIPDRIRSQLTTLQAKARTSKPRYLVSCRAIWHFVHKDFSKNISEHTDHAMSQFEMVPSSFGNEGKLRESMAHCPSTSITQ